MFRVIGNMGRLLQICFAFAMAIFWGGLAYIWSDAGDFGPGRPTVLGLTVLAILAAIGGLYSLTRMLASGARVASSDPGRTSSITQAQRDSDADLMIARFEARRAAENAASDRPDVSVDLERPR